MMQKCAKFACADTLMATIGGKWINWLTKSVMIVQIFTPFSLAVCNVH